jgi:pyruvate formate lyase activating enzyme
VEVTTLVIPGKNDNPAWIREEAKWLASLNPELPLHLSRYFPRYRYTIPPTPAKTIYAMKEAAEEFLRYVYTGNL